MTLVSDGFGFYIQPILEANGLGHLEVITNEQRVAGGRTHGGHAFRQRTSGLRGMWDVQDAVSAPGA